MSRRNKFNLTRFITRSLLLIAGLVFIIKFAGPNMLRQYISFGIGDCKTTPLLCMQPEEKIFTPQINADYLATLVTYAFPKLSISAPKDFTLVQELLKKQYPGRKKIKSINKAVIYLLIQEPGSFIQLYPEVEIAGVRDNREFIRRLMYAHLNQINSLSDAFFVIMKSVFTPDIGNQSTAKMIKFKLADRQGYINYFMAKPNNYFDCNVFDAQGNFFKVYIRDIGAALDLNKVFTIISTLKPGPWSAN